MRDGRIQHTCVAISDRALEVKQEERLAFKGGREMEYPNWEQEKPRGVMKMGRFVPNSARAMDGHGWSASDPG
jgi:hypothetical protein